MNGVNFSIRSLFEYIFPGAVIILFILLPYVVLADGAYENIIQVLTMLNGLYTALLLITISLMVGVLSIWWFYALRRIVNKILKDLNREKAIQKINHFTKGELTITPDDFYVIWTKVKMEGNEQLLEYPLQNIYNMNFTSRIFGGCIYGLISLAVVSMVVKNFSVGLLVFYLVTMALSVISFRYYEKLWCDFTAYSYISMKLKDSERAKME